MSKQLAQVKVLLPGYFQWLGKNKLKFKASSTVTLIQDNGYNILVDTGNEEVEKYLLKALNQQGLKPENIDYLIITHHHPDHVGNKHLFKKAIKTDYLTSYKKGQFLIDFDIINKGKNIITDNVSIISTPGHSLDGCSVIAETDKGIIAVSGDLFVKKQEEKNLVIQNKKEYNKNKKKIIKLADYIIPGHGRMFKVKK
jgi:glyoxylase-like metal-dependent hydrolase (beta-lactamase superfamily II)